MLLTLFQVERKIREFAAIINAPEEFIPTFGTSNQSGLPHIEIDDGQYMLIVNESGEELSRESFDDPDELLFNVLHDISFSMASDLVLEDTNNQSYKERFFQAQKNIISKINMFYTDKTKLKEDTITTEDTKALSESRKNILLKSIFHSRSLPLD